jgi:hypothetical protein
VRLIRQVSITGKICVLMTNLLGREDFPRAEFGDLYLQRRRIEEASKRLKHRLNLEHVSGLSHRAAMHVFEAKIVFGNLRSLGAASALHAASMALTRRCRCALDP